MGRWTALSHTTLLHTNWKMKIFFGKKSFRNSRLNAGRICVRNPRAPATTMSKIIKLSSIGLIDILCVAILVHGTFYGALIWGGWRGVAVANDQNDDWKFASDQRLKSKTRTGRKKTRCSCPQKAATYMSDQRFTVTQTYNRNKLFLFHFYCTPLSYEKKDGTRPPAIRHGKWLCNGGKKCQFLSSQYPNLN